MSKYLYALMMFFGLTAAAQAGGHCCNDALFLGFRSNSVSTVAFTNRSFVNVSSFNAYSNQVFVPVRNNVLVDVDVNVRNRRRVNNNVNVDVNVIQRRR